MSTTKLAERWLELSPEETTLDMIENVLQPVGNAVWITAAVADKIVDDADVERRLLTVGLEKTSEAVERSRKALMSIGVSVEVGDDKVAIKTEESLHASLVTHFKFNPMDELLCRLRTVLFERLDRLDTYVEILRQSAPKQEDIVVAERDVEEGGDAWGWAEETYDSEPKNTLSTKLPFALSTFLRQSLLKSALLLASSAQFNPLRVLLQRHGKVLCGQRLYILQAIPEYVPPSEFLHLLPSIDPSTSRGVPLSDQPWREVADWTETQECTSAFQSHQISAQISNCVEHTASEICQWYHERIRKTDNLGLVDIAFALVQHGASQGVSNLDELGEELGLFSRLVYDAPQIEESYPDNDWTLDSWRLLNPASALKAYLTHSTPRTIADDIRRLAMPYLYVLEARTERAGRPNPGIVNQLFYEYILQSPLELTAAIFDASKPTLPLPERLIKNDEDMARLVLACLYGSDELDSWQTMSRIFECLPAWGDINEEERDEADMTLLSLGDFVAPTTLSSKCSPQELLIFLAPLPFSALSRIIDILDIHLESGEILYKWNVPAPLRWFLQSAHDEKQQRSWAIRMARRAVSGEREPKSEEEWLDLLNDMLKLVGDEGALRGSFGLLSQEEVTRIFFSGLLSSGNFQIAKSVLQKARSPYLSDPQVIEHQVLASCREFYDNATSGSLHQGNMKLAYDCLSVANQSPVIQREREFIEATSRVCSFNIMSRPGIPMSPIEIRLVKDKLSLVARVLATTEDAYKHSRVILDLVHKLGYGDDITAEIKTLAMLADAALQAEDFGRAAETVERMVDTLRKITGSEQLDEAFEVCWHSCFQLGRQSEFHDVEKKMGLLGHALELCQPGHILEVLKVWRNIEADALPGRRDRVMALKGRAFSRRRRAPFSTAEAIRENLEMATGISTTDAAAFAGRTLKNVAATFPFSIRGRVDTSKQPQPEDTDQVTSDPHHDVLPQAKQAFAKGIGWLIGADDE